MSTFGENDLTLPSSTCMLRGWVILLVFLLNEAACITILILSWEQEVQMGGLSYPLSLGRCIFQLIFLWFYFQKVWQLKRVFFPSWWSVNDAFFLKCLLILRVSLQIMWVITQSESTINMLHPQQPIPLEWWMVIMLYIDGIIFIGHLIYFVSQFGKWILEGHLCDLLKHFCAGIYSVLECCTWCCIGCIKCCAACLPDCLGSCLCGLIECARCCSWEMLKGCFPVCFDQQTDPLLPPAEQQADDVQLQFPTVVVEEQQTDHAQLQSQPVVVEEEQRFLITTFSKWNQAKKRDTEDRCAICLVDFENETPIRILSCWHSFHPQCVVLQTTCPLCRSVIQS